MSDERRRARQLMIWRAGQMIREKIGSIDTRDLVEEIRIAALGSLAETRALWGWMKAKGMISDAEYEDALDAGYRSLLQQIEGKAQEIYVPDTSGHG